MRSPDDSANKRYLPERELPPYSYVPGRFPHPISNPSGHWYRRPETNAQPLTDDDWWSNREYLFAVDLFNHGYYWEAHECWESVWLACGRTGISADFLKALIKLAAAGVKAREGRATGIARHARRANALLDSINQRLAADRKTFCGLTIARLQTAATKLEEQPDQYIDRSNISPVVVLPIRLDLADGQFDAC